MIEMRSDTFTLPTRAMLDAMPRAALGDDVYGEDPTVNELETLAARLLDKEAAILMPSGTMANLASILAHCPRGSRVIVGDESDIYIYEAAGAAVCGGISYAAVATQDDGALLVEHLDATFPNDLDDPQFALPSLVCLETTHNHCGGVPLSLSYLAEVAEWARSRGIGVHIDGARVFNAAVALDVPAARIAAHADSLQFCLSKGLSAPIGSIVVGSAAFITRVRRIRKMLGGGMRQAGILAAPAIIALEEMTRRLGDDHAHARRFAQGLAALPGISVDVDRVQTNIVFFRVSDPRFTLETFIHALARGGLNVGELGHGRIRAVTHAGISAADIDAALAIVGQVLERGD